MTTKENTISDSIIEAALNTLQETAKGKRTRRAQPEFTQEISSQPNEAVTDVGDAVPQENVVASTQETEEPSKEDSRQSPEKPEERAAAQDTNNASEVAASKPKPDEILFADLGLSQPVQFAIQAKGYLKPTAIQAQIIPHVLENRDVLAQSQTGTGKTAAFALPLLSKLDCHQKHIQVLVMAPTRELVVQVGKSFEQYGQEINGLSVATVYGGQDYEPQLRKLKKGVQVVIATPGRLIDLIKRKAIRLENLKTLVLDEADEMLNLGFYEDVLFILDKLPVERQIALFSATVPEAIKNIAEKHLQDPIRIRIKKKTQTAESIRQRAVVVPAKFKFETLVRFLEAEKTDGVIVFTKTREDTIVTAEKLLREGFSALALNGDMPQKVRERTIDNLRSGKLDVLVATDVAARGLDVSRISHVFNYDLPHDSEAYIHRVGRTGRAGKNGEAIIFLTPQQRRKLHLIERATKKSIEVIDPPTVDQINDKRVERFKSSITETIAERDLEFFKKMIRDLEKESGDSIQEIAAALAFLKQRGKPFLLKDRPKIEWQKQDHKSGDRRSSNNRKRFQDRDSKSFHRYKIQIGRRDGLRPNNLVGAIANEAGIPGPAIGSINIFDKFCTVDLPKDVGKEQLAQLSRAHLFGKRLTLELTVVSAKPSAQGKKPWRSKQAKPGESKRPNKFRKKKSRKNQ